MYPICNVNVCVCGPICTNKSFYTVLLFCFPPFMIAIFVAVHIYFCINLYAIFLFHIHSFRMNADRYLRAPRLPRFPVVETFEDLPALYLVYYNEPPLPYATPMLALLFKILELLLVYQSTICPFPS